MDEITKKVIGQRINEALAIKDVKQKDLAKAIDVTDNTISYFVNGSRTPNTEQIIKIANFLNVSADYLLGLSSVMTADVELREVCEYTGLTELTVATLVIKKKGQQFNNTNYFKYLNGIISSDKFLEVCLCLNKLKELNETYESKIKIPKFVSSEKAEEYIKQKDKIEKELFELCGDRAEIIDFFDRINYRLYRLENILTDTFLDIAECYDIKEKIRNTENSILEQKYIQVNNEEPTIRHEDLAAYLCGGRYEEDGTEFINKYTVK